MYFRRVIVAGAAYVVYMHLEHQKQIDAMAQELKDAVVGFKVCVLGLRPSGPLDAAGRGRRELAGHVVLAGRGS